MAGSGVVHRVIPTLTTTYPQSLAAVSLVSWKAPRKLVSTVERSEGHWRQSLFKPECREDPRRGQGQCQAALAQGKNPRPAAVGQRAGSGRRSESLAGGSPAGTMRASSEVGTRESSSRKGEGSGLGREAENRVDSDFEKADQPTRSDVARRRKTTALESKAAAGANRP